MNTILGYIAAGLILAYLVRKLYIRLQLSFAKHRSLSGHSRMARRFASWVPFYEYDEDTFFRADGAPEPIALKRRGAFMRLAAFYAERFARSAAETASIAGKVSDLDFTSRYRVPFQFSRYV